MMSVITASIPTKIRTTSERKMLLCRQVIVAYNIPKWMLAKIIAPIIISSMVGLSKNAMERFLLLNPQVLHADIACVMASNQLILADFSSTAVIVVRPIYTDVRIRMMTFER